MRHCLLVIAVCVLVFSGCANHFYQVHGSDMTLVLKQSKAENVVLACSLDQFKPHPARKVDGRWEVVLPSDKSFKYFYRIDGKLYVPDCPLKENDDFGSETCIFDPRL